MHEFMDGVKWGCTNEVVDFRYSGMMYPMGGSKCCVTDLYSPSNISQYVHHCPEQTIDNSKIQRSIPTVSKKKRRRDTGGYQDEFSRNYEQSKSRAGCFW